MEATTVDRANLGIHVRVLGPSDLASAIAPVEASRRNPKAFFHADMRFALEERSEGQLPFFEARAREFGPLRTVLKPHVEDTKAVLLVGGMGTRSHSVMPSTPKVLAPVGNRSFLELLVRQLRWQGIRNSVMCTGYLADQIQDKFGDGRVYGVSIEYSREPYAFGTSVGAIKLAQCYLRGLSDFLVMNGRIVPGN